MPNAAAVAAVAADRALRVTIRRCLAHHKPIQHRVHRAILLATMVAHASGGAADGAGAVAATAGKVDLADPVASRTMVKVVRQMAAQALPADLTHRTPPECTAHSRFDGRRNVDGA